MCSKKSGIDIRNEALYVHLVHITQPVLIYSHHAALTSMMIIVHNCHCTQWPCWVIFFFFFISCWFKQVFIYLNCKNTQESFLSGCQCRRHLAAVIWWPSLRVHTWQQGDVPLKDLVEHPNSQKLYSVCSAEDAVYVLREYFVYSLLLWMTDFSFCLIPTLKTIRSKLKNK